MTPRRREKGAECVLAGRARACYGPLQNHHVIPQQRIKVRHATLRAVQRRGGPRPWALGRALADPRLTVRICWGCHQLIEWRRLYLTRDDLPDGAWEAAAEYGLAWSLEKDFPEAAA